jgi:hypothetical protein
MSKSDDVCEAFAVIAELGNILGAGPLSKYPACWELAIDDRWKIAVNGHKTPMLCSLSEKPIAPFNCLIEYNGFPAGYIYPRGGIIAAGTAANEDTFIKAVRTRIELERTL